MSHKSSIKLLDASRDGSGAGGMWVAATAVAFPAAGAMRLKPLCNSTLAVLGASGVSCVWADCWLFGVVNVYIDSLMDVWKIV